MSKRGVNKLDALKALAESDTLPELEVAKTAPQPAPELAPAQTSESDANAGIGLAKRQTKRIRDAYTAAPEHLERLKRVTRFLQGKGYKAYKGDIIASALEMYEKHIEDELNGGKPLPNSKRQLQTGPF